MIFMKNKSRQNYYMRREIKKDTGKENPTADDVLELIIGKDEYDYNTGDYILYKERNNTKRNFIQRVNLLWVWPLMVLSIPFVYLFTGNFGVSMNSRLGRIVDFLIKFER